MVGSVHFWTTVEFLLALKQVEYNDWISLDIVPRRESPVKACTQSIITMQNMLVVIDKLDLDALAKARFEMNGVESQRLVQNLIKG